MAPLLLDFPPELLVHILAFLPVQALLRFSQTSRYSQSLANSSLHTLSLGIHSSRVSGIISRLAATHYPQPNGITSAFSSSEQTFSASTSCTSTTSSRRSSISADLLSDDQNDDDDAYRVEVLIPDAHAFDFRTLLSFHSALTSSILVRHGLTLRNLDLSLWTMTPLAAKTLSNLSALRALSIRVQDLPHVRGVPRSGLTAMRAEQRAAWATLTQSAAFAHRLLALRIEGGEMTGAHLCSLLRRSRGCRELWLCKSTVTGKELLGFLARQSALGHSALRILGVMRCAGPLDAECLDLIGRLHGLQFLSLQGCYGVDSKVVERRNREEWRIPELVLPMPRFEELAASAIIEVDPEYMSGA